MRFDDFVEILKLAYRGNEDGGLGATVAKTEDGDTGV
jgi:hypothetical protein